MREREERIMRLPTVYVPCTYLPKWRAYFLPLRNIGGTYMLHPPKKAMLIGRIADIVWSGRGPGFISQKVRETGDGYEVKLQHTFIDSIY